MMTLSFHGALRPPTAQASVRTQSSDCWTILDQINLANIIWGFLMLHGFVVCYTDPVLAGDWRMIQHEIWAEKMNLCVIVLSNKYSLLLHHSNQGREGQVDWRCCFSGGQPFDMMSSELVGHVLTYSALLFLFFFFGHESKRPLNSCLFFSKSAQSWSLLHFSVS